MFYISKTLANYARRERYYISKLAFSILYTLACIIKVLESIAILLFIILSIWALYFITL